MVIVVGRITLRDDVDRRDREEMLLRDRELVDLRELKDLRDRELKDLRLLDRELWNDLLELMDLLDLEDQLRLDRVLRDDRLESLISSMELLFSDFRCCSSPMISVSSKRLWQRPPLQ